MVVFWDVVNKVIRESDLLLLILDSRMVEETRNIEIEHKINNEKKPFIYVFNKCDLIEKSKIEHYKKKFKPSVFVSSTEYHGLKLLRERILIESKKIGITKKVKVGILGYPNVGKSSLINAMSGRGSAKTSSISGFTKGAQIVNIDNKISFIDTPGVIPYKENNPLKHGTTGIVDSGQVKDPEGAVYSLLEKYPGIIEKHYDVPLNNSFDETLETIGLKKNFLIKKNLPDINRTAKAILTDWFKGLIKT